MKVIPLTIRAANDYISKNHRHHARVQGCKFCIGVVDETENLRGVAVVGRPIARHLDNGLTAEVTRLCTDGYKNACSFLYSACLRIAKNMGYKKILTYILETENGASLKASNWLYGGICGGGNWNTPSRPRKDSKHTNKKKMYYKNL